MAVDLPMLRIWQRLGTQQRAIVRLVAGCLAAWVVYAAILRPLARQWSRLRQEVREAKAALVEAVRASLQADSVNHAFAAYEAYARPSGSVDSALPTALSEVEAAVREVGMSRLDLKPSSSCNETTAVLCLTMEAESTPSQLVQLLDQLQRSPHLFKVTELRVRVTEGKTLRSSLVISKLLLR